MTWNSSQNLRILANMKTVMFILAKIDHRYLTRSFQLMPIWSCKVQITLASFFRETSLTVAITRGMGLNLRSPQI